MTQLARRTLPTARQLMNHVLDEPELMAALRELPGPILGKLIDKVGLEEAAELVALATTEQLASMFDSDLWRAQEGDWEERFDPARFALWLHAFSEAGEDALVARLVQLPLDLLILAVHRLILVVDIDAIAVEMSDSHDDLDQLEKALESCLYEEWEEFRLIARDHSAWDVVNQALFALDRDHHALLRRILERCAAMSSESIESNGGLYEVLSSDEMLEGDVRAERDDRRAEKGYISPADAKAFLELARRGLVPENERDAITQAYFREMAPSKGRLAHPPDVSRSEPSARQNRLLRLLEQAKIVEPTRVRGLPQPKQCKSTRPEAPSQTHGPLPEAAGAQLALAAHAGSRRLLDDALAALHEANPERYGQRIEEIAYLANVLVSAPRSDGQRLRPIEALDLALTVSDRGLAMALGPMQQASRSNLLQTASAKLDTTSADALFRMGYRETHRAHKR